MIEQVLKQQGYSDENIAKIKVVMSNQEAYQYAMSTGNFEAAYNMAVGGEKPPISLDKWFSSFLQDSPEDAAALSTGLTKFARFVQSMTDKGKTPQ